MDERKETSDSGLQKLRELSKKLIETESEMSAFFNLCPVLFCIVNKNGYFHKVNEAWEKIFGWTAEEICAIPYIDLIHPDDMASTFHARQTLKSGTPLIGFVNRYRCKDGSYKKLMWRCSPYQDREFTYTTAQVVPDTVIYEQPE